MRSDHNGQFSKPIKQELERKNIPFSDAETVNEILGSETCRKAMSLLRLAVNREELRWLGQHSFTLHRASALRSLIMCMKRPVTRERHLATLS